MMHHRCCCGSSQGHVMDTCTCGMYHSETTSYGGSMLFSMPPNNGYDEYYEHDEMYNSSFTPSPSSVDCTLSLGTPSTRLTQQQKDDDHDDINSKRHRHQRRSELSNFRWSMFQSKHNNTQSQTKSNDSLLARRCANCDTTSTPLWRNGPRGPKSLCNACGIRFKKEERRASAAAAAATSAVVSGGAMESARVYGHHQNNSWYAANSQSQKMMGNEFRFMDDSEDRGESENINNGIPFLSWKLNVPDRTNLVHDERW